MLFCTRVTVTNLHQTQTTNILAYKIKNTSKYMPMQIFPIEYYHHWRELLSIPSLKLYPLSYTLSTSPCCHNQRLLTGLETSLVYVYSICYHKLFSCTFILNFVFLKKQPHTHGIVISIFTHIYKHTHTLTFTLKHTHKHL